VRDHPDSCLSHLQAQLTDLRLLELTSVILQDSRLAALWAPCAALLRHGVWGRRAAVLGLQPQGAPAQVTDAAPPVVNGSVAIVEVARADPAPRSPHDIAAVRSAGQMLATMAPARPGVDSAAVSDNPDQTKLEAALAGHTDVQAGTASAQQMSFGLNHRTGGRPHDDVQATQQPHAPNGLDGVHSPNGPVTVL
jgi:hypothetical protein